MYKLVRDQAELDQIEIDYSEPVFCDTETCPDRGRTNLAKKPGGLYGKVRLFQFYQKGWKQAILVDCFFVDLKSVTDKLQNCLTVWHNATYDLHTINQHVDWYPRDVHDTFYLSKAKFYDGESFDFFACLEYADLSDETIENIDKKANQKAEWDKRLTPVLLTYAACDVLYLSLLYDKVIDAMDYPCELDHDNIEYAVKYDKNGLPISREAIRNLKKRTLLKLEEYSNKCPVNINSPAQCQKWLGVASTDAYVIGTLALKGNEDAYNLVEARKASKLLQFLEKYDNDRVYAFHNPCGARTSRMTCTGGDVIWAENNQNPPRPLYPCIQAKEGYAIVYNDYAGLELRTAVAYVGETVMYDLMMDGTDLHTYNACKIFNVTEETMDPQQRWVTKVFTFSSIYGAGPTELQNQLQAKGRIHMEIDEVKRIGKEWFKIYQHFKQWHDLQTKMMRVYGYVDTVTLLGRKMRAYRRNDTFNFPIQGSAAEVTKMAVHLLCSRYPAALQWIINVVHDSLSMEVPLDDAQLWKERLDECMSEAWGAVIQYAALPDLTMPVDAEAHVVWPGCDESWEELIEQGMWDGALPEQIRS